MSGAWWQRGVIYQIYPRSFQDSDGDGIGDLKGIESRLAYLSGLGIDAIWISPIYPSPMADGGYDVVDYCDVDSRFGTLVDFDRLMTAAHEKGIRVILDFVPNHSSDQHPWFVASRSGRTSPKRDWYIWRDPAPGGGPPNNWISDFGGSAWTWDERSGQYYLHAFLEQQPDLNWRNAAVCAAMYEVLRFWLARGVDGFRIDVLWHLIKAQGFPDNPPNPAYRAGIGEVHRVLQVHSTDQPEVHTIAGEMRRIADGFGARVLIGEIYLPLERLVHYYGPDNSGVHLPFNFQLVDAPWSARALRAMIEKYEAALPSAESWPNWVLGNHDRPRIAARLGEAQARIAAMLLLTLRGTPTLYYGDELGIGHVEIPPECVQDPRELLEPGLDLGRDPVRTPMPWDATPNAGFTTGAPWLPLNADWAERNVARLAAAPGSILSLHERLLALRRAHPALSIGDVTLMEGLDAAPDVLAYERHHEGVRIVIALNLGSSSQVLLMPAWLGSTLLLSTTEDEDAAAHAAPDDGRVVLRPDEGVIFMRRSG